MALNKFSAGVNTSFSTQLNQNTGIFIGNTIRVALASSLSATNLLNTYLNAVSATTDLSSKTGAMIDTTNNKVFFYQNIDDFEDASIAAGWTTSGASVTEGSGYIGAALSDVDQTNTWYWSSKNFKSLTGDSEIYIRAQLRAQATTSGDSEGSLAYIRITDGSSTVNIFGYDRSSGSGTDTFDGTVIIYIDKTNSNAYYSTDGGASWSGATSISALSAWYIQGYLEHIDGGPSGTPASSYHRWLDIGYINASDVGGNTVNAIFTGGTITSASAGVVSTISSSGTIQPSLSFNGGSNYNDVAFDALVSGTAGTSLRLKFTATLPSTALALANKPHAPRMSKFGAMYG